MPGGYYTPLAKKKSKGFYCLIMKKKYILFGLQVLLLLRMTFIQPPKAHRRGALLRVTNIRKRMDK